MNRGATVIGAVIGGAATQPRPPKYPGWLRLAILFALPLILWAAIVAPIVHLKGY